MTDELPRELYRPLTRAKISPLTTGVKIATLLLLSVTGHFPFNFNQKYFYFAEIVVKTIGCLKFSHEFSDSVSSTPVLKKHQTRSTFARHGEPLVPIYLCLFYFIDLTKC